MSTIATLSSFDGALNGDGGDVVTRYKAFARFSERMIKQTFFNEREHIYKLLAVDLD